MSQNDPAADAPGANQGADPHLDLPAGMFRSSEDIRDAILSMMRHGDIEFSAAKVAVLKDGRRKLGIFEGDIILGTADEIQGLTANGIGSGTVIENLQIHNSRDDGVEVFGGTVNMKRLVLTGNADDSLDTDIGYRGSVQYVVAVRRTTPAVAGDTAGGQTILEVDSSGREILVPFARSICVEIAPGERTIRVRLPEGLEELNP